MRTLVLSNGDFKSGFITGLAVKECGAEDVRLLLINHGQVAYNKQAEAVQDHADHYGVPYTVLNHGELAGGMFKVTTMLFTALSYAVTSKYDRVYYGACKPLIKTNFNYEMTYTHLRNMQLIMNAARVENKYSVMPVPEAPCMLLNLGQIATLAKSYNVPLELTWNCNCNGLKHCGECAACTEWRMAIKNNPKVFKGFRSDVFISEEKRSGGIMKTTYRVMK